MNTVNSLLKCKDFRVEICKTCVEFKQERDSEFKECSLYEQLVEEHSKKHGEKRKLLLEAVKEVEFLREIWSSLGNGDNENISPNNESVEEIVLQKGSLENVDSGKEMANEPQGETIVCAADAERDSDDGLDISPTKKMPPQILETRGDEYKELKDDGGDDNKGTVDESKKMDGNNEDHRACYQLCRWIIGNDSGNCKLCKKVCTVTELQTHIAEEHIRIGAQPDTMTYFCQWEDCNSKSSTFKSKRELLDHITCHTFDKKYRCTVHKCGRLFSSKSDLEDHKSTHIRRGSFIMKRRCAECGIRFLRKSSLVKHKALHSDGLVPGKMHHCPSKGCGKVFVNSKELVEHKRSHAVEEFPCTQQGCPSVFSSEGFMKIHYTMVHKDTDSSAFK